MKGKTFWVVALAAVAGGGVLAWQFYQARTEPAASWVCRGQGADSNRSRWT